MTFDDVNEQTIAYDDPVRVMDAAEEAATTTPKLRRRDSNISNGGHSRRNSIGPVAALPIAYRTMSMGIDEPDDQKRRDDLKKHSSKTAVGVPGVGSCSRVGTNCLARTI
ncbi:hypothetical protein V1507DRAFT_227932 [Lipomyces tetrasporus]